MNLWAEHDRTGHSHRQPSSSGYGRHAAGHHDAVSVATLLEEARRDGRPLWLDWPDEVATPIGVPAARTAEVDTEPADTIRRGRQWLADHLAPESPPPLRTSSHRDE